MCFLKNQCKTRKKALLVRCEAFIFKNESVSFAFITLASFYQIWYSDERPLQNLLFPWSQIANLKLTITTLLKTMLLTCSVAPFHHVECRAAEFACPGLRSRFKSCIIPVYQNVAFQVYWVQCSAFICLLLTMLLNVRLHLRNISSQILLRVGDFVKVYSQILL